MAIIGTAGLTSGDGCNQRILQVSSLRAALQARSFKNNIIISVDSRVEITATFLHRMHQEGYGQLLLVGPSEAYCQGLVQLFGDLVGCGWYSLEFLMSLLGPLRPGGWHLAFLNHSKGQGWLAGCSANDASSRLNMLHACHVFF
jgi:hypothetical protein